MVMLSLPRGVVSATSSSISVSGPASAGRSAVHSKFAARGASGLVVPAVIAALLCIARTTFADTVTINPYKDNTLYDHPNGDVSNGLGEYLFSGRTANQGELYDRRRAVLAFNIVGSVPAGSTINSVSLTLRMSRTTDGAIRRMSIYKLQQDWGEGTSDAFGNEGSGTTSTSGDATWIHRFYNLDQWTIPGGTFNNIGPSTSSNVGGTGDYTWSSAPMAADVQQWLDNPATNFGWILVGDESTTRTARRFNSRQHGTANTRPRLLINFTPPSSGACCLPIGTCATLTPAQCSAQNGTYQGNNTTCTPGLCPTFGACCLNSGNCSTLSSTDCAAASGTYNGDGSLCVQTVCPVILEPFVDALPIPAVATPTSGTPGGEAYYEISITQQFQTLHRDLPPTKTWGYNGTFPGPTILATRDQPVTVRWINNLRDEQNNYLTEHALPVDHCPHGAHVNSAPPRVVVHLHGGHVSAADDGYPEFAFPPGSDAIYNYPNEQLPATLWYHDHALGITRLNVTMGLAGFYLIGDAEEAALGLPAGAYDIGLAIQDRTFNSDGSFQYPAMWMEHFFGDTILVNGKVWPYLNVKRGKYRFRLLNGSTSRTYTLALSNGATFQQIASDGGLFPAPVPLTSMTFSPGERAELVIDFEPYTAGTEIILTNSAPAPFPGGVGVGVVPNVMKFVVGSDLGHTAAIPGVLRPLEPLPPAQAVQQREFVLRALTEPCTGTAWYINGLLWDDITEFPMLGTSEIWSFINRSGTVHPMHMHLVMFQVLDRQPFQIVGEDVVPIGSPVSPPANEVGWKDTVRVYPFEITRVIAKFEDYTGLFPYHCHILEHEDHEMMRQFMAVCKKGDTNQDTRVDGEDIGLFVHTLLTGGAPGTAAFCATDMDDDGQLEQSEDIALFVECLIGGACP